MGRGEPCKDGDSSRIRTVAPHLPGTYPCRLVVALHFSDFLLQLLHLLFLQDLFIFDRDDLYEFIHILVPVVKHFACEVTASEW